MTNSSECARVAAKIEMYGRTYGASPETIRRIINERRNNVDHKYPVTIQPETPGFLQNLTDFTGPFGNPLIQEMRKQDWKTNEEQAPAETVSHGLLVDRSHAVFALLHRLSFFGLPHDAFFGPIRFNPEGANVTVFGPVFEPDVVIENISRGKVIDPQWQLVSVTTDFYQQTASVTLREKDEVSLRPKRVTITYRVAGVAHRP